MEATTTEIQTKEESSKTVVFADNTFEDYLKETFQANMGIWCDKVCKTEPFNAERVEHQRRIIKAFLEWANQSVKQNDKDKALTYWTKAAYESSFIGAYKVGEHFCQLYFAEENPDEKFSHFCSAVKFLAKALIFGQYPLAHSLDQYFVEKNYVYCRLDEVAINYINDAHSCLKKLIAKLDSSALVIYLKQMLTESEEKEFWPILGLLACERFLALKKYDLAIITACEVCGIAGNVTNTMPPKMAQVLTQRGFAVIQQAFRQADPGVIDKIRKIEFGLTVQLLFSYDALISEVYFKPEFEKYLEKKFTEDLRAWENSFCKTSVLKAAFKKASTNIEEILRQAKDNIEKKQVESANMCWLMAGTHNSFVGSLRSGMNFYRIYKAENEAKQKFEYLILAIKYFSKAYIYANYQQVDSYELLYFNKHCSGETTFEVFSRKHADLAYNNFRSLLFSIDTKDFGGQIEKLATQDGAIFYKGLLYLVAAERYLELKNYSEAIITAAKACHIADNIMDYMPPKVAQFITKRAFTVLQWSFRKIDKQDMQEIFQIDFGPVCERLFELDNKIIQKLSDNDESDIFQLTANKS